jgi:hypothetical protein
MLSVGAHRHDMAKLSSRASSSNSAWQKTGCLFIAYERHDMTSALYSLVVRLHQCGSCKSRVPQRKGNCCWTSRFIYSPILASIVVTLFVSTEPVSNFTKSSSLTPSKRVTDTSGKAYRVSSPNMLTRSTNFLRPLLLLERLLDSIKERRLWRRLGLKVSTMERGRLSRDA